jgi:hypothetical protein
MTGRMEQMPLIRAIIRRKTLLATAQFGADYNIFHPPARIGPMSTHPTRWCSFFSTISARRMTSTTTWCSLSLNVGALGRLLVRLDFTDQPECSLRVT